MADEPNQSPVETPRIIVVPRGQVVVRPGEVDKTRQTIRQLAWFLDSAFEVPGTKYRIGIDPLIGLIPVLGDLISMAIGSYIVLTASKLGVPRTVVMRMLVNLGIDVVLGAIPFVGDLVDAGWKANSKNARLLEQALDNPKAVGRSSFWVVLGMLTALLALTVGAIVLSVWLVRLVIRATA